MMTPTSVYYFRLAMQEIECLEKLNDGSLDKPFVETAAVHEDSVYVADAHLADLKNECDMFAMGASHLERSE
jgi:hypothetical protein